MDVASVDLISTDPDLLESRHYIYNKLDLTNICNKLVDVFCWKPRQAAVISKLYRNYLFLIRKYCNTSFQLPPSHDIDDFWHQHILDTIQYKKDCDAIFGQYLEHYPYLGIDDKTDMKDLKNYFERTQTLHQQEFGKPIYVVRTKWDKVSAYSKQVIKGM